MRIFFAPYNMRVRAARILAERLGGMRILPERSRYRYRNGDVVVNWGRSDFDQAPEDATFNYNVRSAIDKARAWELFRAANVQTVESTTDIAVAERWGEEGHVVLARSTLTGMGGRGITVHQPGVVLPHGPHTYVKYFKSRAEYRVHVFNGKVIDAQQKKKRNGVDANQFVRSYDNGWVFCRGGVEVPEVVKTASIAAVKALGLDFGGMDVGYNETRNQACVFEVNSAPGIEGTTLDNYEDAIRRAIS